MGGEKCESCDPKNTDSSVGPVVIPCQCDDGAKYVVNHMMGKMPTLGQPMLEEFVFYLEHEAGASFILPGVILR